MSDSDSPILILGGVATARHLADRLVGEGRRVLYSLAGTTRHPSLPSPSPRLAVRRGGFGGAAGMRDVIEREGVALVIDATHPFASRVASHAVEASRSAGIPCMRLVAPAWRSTSGDCRLDADDADHASRLTPSGARVLHAAGRDALAPFRARRDLDLLAARVIERRDDDIDSPPLRWLSGRPPFSESDEVALMRSLGVTHVVAKNSGHEASSAKLSAARTTGATLILIRRPLKAVTVEASSLEEASRTASRLLGGGSRVFVGVGADGLGRLDRARSR